MDKQECISQLEDLKKQCMDWSPEPLWNKDVEALDMAISALKGTALEVPVQEQYQFVPEDSEGKHYSSGKSTKCKL